MPLLTFPISETTLGNGLRVIVVETGAPDVVSLQIPVQTGSRNEVEPGKTGFAHFFEHMMFRGTEAYPPEEYQEILTRAGARQNAYTTDDYTNYHITFDKRDLEKMLEIEADRFQRLSYPLEGFRTEARAVLGEYNKSSADPEEKLFEVMHDHAYTTHPYKHTTMGFLTDIEDMPNQFDYSRTFFQRWYRPEYTTIILVGDVTPETALPLVERYWAGWQPGGYTVDIPREGEPAGPVYAHVPWAAETLPWVTVSFHGPAFSTTDSVYAATDLLVDLWFGHTSALYRRLVEDEQLVDLLFAFTPDNVDPGLITIGARVKSTADVPTVRDAILATAAEARGSLVPARRVADAKSNMRYGFVRELDDTETIAATLASYVHYARTTSTIEDLFRSYAAVTPRDVRTAAREFLTDERLVVTTLSHEALPPEIARPPRIDSLRVAARPAPADAADLDISLQRTPFPQLCLKLVFTAGSVHDPRGKEGLAALAASMVAEAGSREMRIDEITRAFYPMAASFDADADKEMTAFTASVHRDQWKPFADIVFPMLLDPGFRRDDFARLRDAQLSALTQDLRSSNEEELARERLQEVSFRGTPHAHPVLGTVAGVQSITLDDVRDFVASRYVRANLIAGIAGDVSDATLTRLRAELAKLPEGTPAPAIPIDHEREGGENATATQHEEHRALASNMREREPGIHVDIIEKDTRASSISIGIPITITRGDPDFVALWLARAWLGEHRSSVSHLYQRIREIRGLNYGDYAYIEAFPGAMFSFFPDANRARRRQLFEIWIRPVLPDHAHMALRIAIHELRSLIERGIDEESFERTRDYLIKSAPLLTATQDHRLGYALDSRWYGIPDFTTYVREGLGRLTAHQVSSAIRRNISGYDLTVVIVARDAAALREALIADTVSTITYDSPKPPEILAEDQVVGRMRLGIAPEKVSITQVEDVFAH